MEARETELSAGCVTNRLTDKNLNNYIERKYSISQKTKSEMQNGIDFNMGDKYNMRRKTGF
jgi:hypothetical protein